MQDGAADAPPWPAGSRRGATALGSGAFVPPAALCSHGTSPLLPPGNGLGTLEGFSSSFQIADAIKNIKIIVKLYNNY